MCETFDWNTQAKEGPCMFRIEARRNADVPVKVKVNLVGFPITPGGMNIPVTPMESKLFNRDTQIIEYFQISPPSLSF